MPVAHSSGVIPPHHQDLSQLLHTWIVSRRLHTWPVKAGLVANSDQMSKLFLVEHHTAGLTLPWTEFIVTATTCECISDCDCYATQPNFSGPRYMSLSIFILLVFFWEILFWRPDALCPIQASSLYLSSGLQYLSFLQFCLKLSLSCIIHFTFYFQFFCHLFLELASISFISFSMI